MTLWVCWFVACLVSLLILEAYVLITGQPTLSQVMWALATRYPLFSVTFGMIVGGVVIHLFERP